MMKSILLGMTISLLLAGIASATVGPEDVIIHPDGVEPIKVGVDPNPISPPVKVEFVDWTTAGGSQYAIKVTNDVTGATVCSVAGTIDDDPLIVELPTCKIPAGDIHVPHTITATGFCNRPDCVDITRSKSISIDAGLDPVPELPTGVLLSAGLIGLISLARYRRKE